MSKPIVAIVRYQQPGQSVAEAVEMSQGLDNLKPGATVFIKPNIVFWTSEPGYPKWGTITTSRTVEDMVVLLKERGAGRIIIGEGTILRDPKDRQTMLNAFETLGYNKLKARYGVELLDLFARPFDKVDLGDGVSLNFNTDILHSDLVVDLPVLKTHAQTVVSLGLKNLKGTIDIPSRKKCHNAEPGRDLNFMVARLADRLPPVFTLIDGIFSNERGPAFDGKVHRSNLLVASSDLLAADLVGCRLLGHDPAKVPHLAIYAANHGRTLDLEGLELRGLDLASEARLHEHDFPYTEGGRLPLPLAKLGVQGLTYPKYDLTLCTYCSGINGLVLTAIAQAWRGQPWTEIEVLTGKAMQPTPGHQKTILLGKCMCQANKDHPDIQQAIAINGCPPKPEKVAEALIEAGIPVNPAFFQNLDKFPTMFMKRYLGKAEFDEALFQVS